MIKPVAWGRSDGGPVTVTADRIDAINEFRKDILAKVQKEFSIPLYGQEAIDHLTAERDALAERWLTLEALLRRPNTEIVEGGGHHEAGRFVLDFDGGVWRTSHGEFPTLASVTE